MCYGDIDFSCQYDIKNCSSMNVLSYIRRNSNGWIRASIRHHRWRCRHLAMVQAAIPTHHKSNNDCCKRRLDCNESRIPRGAGCTSRMQGNDHLQRMQKKTATRTPHSLYPMWFPWHSKCVPPMPEMRPPRTRVRQLPALQSFNAVLDSRRKLKKSRSS